MTDSSGADGLQQIVDALALRLGRSVAVDDTHGRLVVASRHFGDEDPLRTYAVMQRSSDLRVLEHFAEHDIYRWTAPGRIPGRTDLAFKARVCCPIRAHDLAFGHLFLIDDGVSDVDIGLAAAAADEIGEGLHRRLVLHDEAMSHRGTLARELLDADPAVRAAARRTLVTEQLVDAPEPALALSIHLPLGTGATPTALRVALEHLARHRYLGTFLTTAVGRQGTLLLLGGSATHEAGRALANRLTAELQGENGTERVVVGIGSVTRGPDAAFRSHDEARRAAEAAVLLPGLGDVVEADDLGAYAVLLALPRHLVGPDLYPAALRRLLGHDSHDGLLDTLEAYLDRGGDATRTAAELHIHRSTFYYRLSRIESIAGVDLRDGTQRLALHLGLKLRRVLAAHED